MSITELNNYIEHYLEEDKTHTAIKLTGECKFLGKMSAFFLKKSKRIDALLFYYMVLRAFLI